MEEIYPQTFPRNIWKQTNKHWHQHPEILYVPIPNIIMLRGSLNLQSQNKIYSESKALSFRFMYFLKVSMEPGNFSSEISATAQNKYNLFDK